MAIWDEASSVHYHPWRGDGALSYIIANTRYDLLPPPADWAWQCALAARSFLVRRRSLLGRVLVGSSRGPACGSFMLCVEEHKIEWDVVCWSAGKRFGVEFFRVAPLDR